MTKLIVEMEMPTRCPCVLAVDNIGWFSPCFADHGIPSRTKDFDDCIEKGTRPDWCPIKGVLPEEHGDLEARLPKIKSQIYDLESMARREYDDDRDNEYLEGYFDGLHQAAKLISTVED